MRLLPFTLLLSSLLVTGAAQQPNPTNTPQAGESAKSPQASSASKITAPELLPVTFPTHGSEECSHPVTGVVYLSFFLNEKGQAVNPGYLQVQDNGLNQLALQILEAESFKPTLQGGRPVVTPLAIEIQLDACAEEFKDNAGKKQKIAWLKEQPVQQLHAWTPTPEEIQYARSILSKDSIRNGFSTLQEVGSRQEITPPKVLHTVDPEFSNETRQKGIGGTVVISLTVDANGIPHNFHVVRAAGYGLDQAALNAVRQYRFQPAHYRGEPVSFPISIRIDY